eukprot:2198356-Rhodomonas_salina.2
MARRPTFGTSLHRSYAKSGTDVAYAATHLAYAATRTRCAVLSECMLLRACAMRCACSSDTAYGPTHVLRNVQSVGCTVIQMLDGHPPWDDITNKVRNQMGNPAGSVHLVPGTLLIARCPPVRAVLSKDPPRYLPPMLLPAPYVIGSYPLPTPSPRLLRAPYALPTSYAPSLSLRAPYALSGAMLLRAPVLTWRMLLPGTLRASGEPAMTYARARPCPVLT